MASTTTLAGPPADAGVSGSRILDEDVAEEEEAQSDHAAAKLLRTAHIASQVDRPEDAVRFLEEAGNLLYESSPDRELAAGDRALLARTLKQVVNPLRSQVRALFSQQMVQSATAERVQHLLFEYRAAKSAELEMMCRKVVNLSRDVFLPMASQAESRVFFNKLAGDHSRYVCEIPLSSPSQEDLAKHEEVMESTEAFYLRAYDEALSDLSPTNVLRLSLILNISIFYQEVRRDSERACEYAQSAYDDAAAELGLESAEEAEAFLFPNASEDSQGRPTNASIVSDKTEGRKTVAAGNNMLLSMVEHSIVKDELDTSKVLRNIKMLLGRWGA